MIDVLEQFRFILLISFALVALWIIVITDVLVSKLKGKNKILWILIITFLPVLGAIFYLTIGRYSEDD